MTQMDAATYKKYGASDVLTVESVDKPIPAHNEVLIKIRATSVTSVDIAFRSGKPLVARVFTGLTKPKQQILGTELAGEIAQIGAEVTRFAVGDQVFAAPADGNGAHAEYITLSQDGAIARKPSNMSFDEAAALCNGGLTALPFLRDHGEIKPGDKVLINGASGSVGIFAVQLAQIFGAEVTGVCSTRNLELVRSLGVDDVIDYTKQDVAALGQKYDIIFDTSGKSSFWKCRKILAPTGVFLTTGLSAALATSKIWTMLIGKKRVIFAATGLRPAPDQFKDMEFIRDLVEAGKLRTIIDRSYPLDRIADAHEFVEHGQKCANVVITTRT